MVCVCVCVCAIDCGQVYLHLQRLGRIKAHRCSGTESLHRPYGLCRLEIKLYSFLTTALEGSEGSASHPGRSLRPAKTRYPLYRRLGGPQVRKISPPTGIRTPGRPARSQSLYRLSYRAHLQRLGRRVRLRDKGRRLRKEGCIFSCKRAEGAANDSTLTTAGS